MNNVVCCPLNGPGWDLAATLYDSQIRRAAKDHRCSECREPIKRGDRYEHVSGLWDRKWSRYRTCLSCVEIRDHFACREGWAFGQVWSDIEENFFPGMVAGGPCMEGLSPAAKARLFERRLAWLEDQ